MYPIMSPGQLSVVIELYGVDGKTSPPWTPVNLITR